jgi:UDP-N-acetylglucosamine 1-carboxyvinyltransferase
VSKFLVKGCEGLCGNVRISGSKNATMPVLIACLLLDDSFCNKICFKNISFCDDISIVLQILRSLGVNFKIDYKDEGLMHFCKYNTVNNISNDITTLENASLIRTSIIFMGPLLAISGGAKIPIPGGCKIGDRKIDIHIEIAQMMGCDVVCEDEYIQLKCKNSTLNAVNTRLRLPSVGASHNAIMMASLANGVSVIQNISIEPEVIHLIHFLQFCGADIIFDKTNKQVTINGTGGKLLGLKNQNFKEFDFDISRKASELNLLSGDSLQNLLKFSTQKNTNLFCFVSDRIEAATFAIAAGITKSSLTLNNCVISLFEGMIEDFKKVGIKLTQIEDNSVLAELYDKNSIYSSDIIADVFPNFPTDCQPQIMALLCIANKSNKESGKNFSQITENIFEKRFSHVEHLNKMGANIAIDTNNAIINQVSNFNSIDVDVYGGDLRSCASLVLAAIARPKDSETIVQNIEQLDRGYEFFEKKLNACGANIKRISDQN